MRYSARPDPWEPRRVTSEATRLLANGTPAEQPKRQLLQRIVLDLNHFLERARAAKQVERSPAGKAAAQHQRVYPTSFQAPGDLDRLVELQPAPKPVAHVGLA